ncbi:MAG: thioredoxin family protein [Pseudomonadota bacterium]
MTEKPVTQIQIGAHRVGLVGLMEAFEAIALDDTDRSDAVIAHALIERLSRENYIPAHVHTGYGAALVREFRRYLGQAVAETEPEVISVRVLGPGCAQCDRLMADVVAVLSELNLPADVEHVRDMKAIAGYGVMGVPALVVDNRVLFSGGSPPRQALRDALAKIRENPLITR